MTNWQIPSANQLPSINHLLGALPPADYARVVRSLDVISLELKQTVHKAGEPVEHVYFPGGGFVSMLTVLEDGSMVEISTIGREGVMLGASRPMVTVVAGTLQNAGLITYHRGHLTIVDREKLEAASCECYRVSAHLLKRVTAKAGGKWASLTATP